MEKSLSRSEMARAFNEWMRRYTEEPERFAAEFETVSLFLHEGAVGLVPSYGETSASYLFKINEEIEAALKKVVHPNQEPGAVGATCDGK